MSVPNHTRAVWPHDLLDRPSRAPLAPLPARCTPPLRHQPSQQCATRHVWRLGGGGRDRATRARACCCHSTAQHHSTSFLCVSSTAASTDSLFARTPGQCAHEQRTSNTLRRVCERDACVSLWNRQRSTAAAWCCEPTHIPGTYRRTPRQPAADA
jgi:hypothetical protein